MTTVTFHKESGIYKSFSFEGHAGFDKYGKDIVCAGISALVINTINSLEQITKEDIKVDYDEDQGVINCLLPDDLKDSSIVLLDSLVLGISQIENQYGKKYCKLEFEEV